MVTFWKKSAKEEGISCVIRAKNEAEWIRPSIASILDFADEIVFVDNGSTDGTLEAVRELKEEWGIDKLKVYTFPPIDGKKIKIADLYNFSFAKATKTWAFKWDADFIARTGQIFSIMELKELWLEYRNKADVFRLSAPNLFGDHLHYYHSPPDDQELCFERYLFRNRKYTHRMGDYFETLVLKAHKRFLDIGPMANPDDRRIYFFHLQGLKSDQRITSRATLSLWWNYSNTNADRSMTYEQWLGKHWGTTDTEEQVKKCMETFFKTDSIKQYEKVGGDWGEYPTTLKPYLESPKYEVEYVDGKPGRRITHHDRTIPVPEKLSP